MKIINKKEFTNLQGFLKKIGFKNKKPIMYLSYIYSNIIKIKESDFIRAFTLKKKNNIQ